MPAPFFFGLHMEPTEHCDVEDYRGKTIPCTIGTISPVFGNFINYFRLEAGREHKETVRTLITEVKGFHTIEETPTCVISTFDADDLPTVLRMVGKGDIKHQCF